MIKSLMRRAYLLVLALVLVGAAFASFHRSTVLAQGGFDYMCNAWEETCDNGSGDPYGGGGGGGGGSPGGAWKCPNSDVCGNFGCHERSYVDHTQICSRYNFDGVPANCSSPVNCTQ